MADWSRVEALLDQALDRPAGDREAFVRAQAGEDRALVREVLALVAAAERSGTFLETDGQGAEAETPAQVGAWRIIALVGRGGMGEVHDVARADGEYRQRAALKLMRPLPEAQAARFQTERQILATLDHPGIARLLDGGVAPDGRPYMVMEFVDGLPIDRHCAAHGVDARGRVALVRQAADAVAHAHAKLVVHRDIKPSNLLVTPEGRTRLIDFGVARLAAPGPSAPTELPISIEYAAPELLEGRPATTATDVYGLAATLYHLLAGRPPIAVGEAPLGIAVRRIAEETPPPIGIGPVTIGVALRRDLDAILARALRKEPEARYQTVAAFAEDLERALDGAPVAARRGERFYAIGRFARRRKWPLAAAAAIALALGGGIGAALWQASEARLQRDAAVREQARLEAVQQYLYFMLRSAAETGGPGADVGRVLQAASARVIDQFDRDPARGGPVLHALGELYFYIDDYEAAEPLLRRLVEARGVDAQLAASAAYDMAQVRLRQARPREAAAMLARAQAYWRADPARWESRLVDSRLVEARLLRDNGDVEGAVALLQQHLPARIALSGPTHRETGVYHNDLGVMLTAAGRRDEAIGSFQAAHGVWRAAGLDNGPDALNTLNNLAALHVLSGRPAQAEPLFRRAVALRRQLYGGSAATAALLSNHGKTLLQLGRTQEAIGPLEEAVSMARSFAGAGSLHYASAVAGLSEARLEHGEPAVAARLSQEALASVRAELGDTHPASAVLKVSLARVQAAQGRTADAARLLNEAQSALAALGPAGTPQREAIARIRNRYRLPAG